MEREIENLIEKEIEKLEEQIERLEERIFDLERECQRLAQDNCSLEDELSKMENELGENYILAKAIHEIQEELSNLNGFVAINKLNAPTRVGMK